MRNQRLSFEEFRTLFRDRFESEEQLRKEYESFRAVFERLEALPVPELSARAKADIFRRSWPGARPDWSWAWTWLAFFRRPAATFALGLLLGCLLMLAVLNRPPVPPRRAPANPPLTIERSRYMQVYQGKIVEAFYPQIEDPRIVLEQGENASPPQRVLYGTLDNGEIYVVWNL